MTRQEAGQIGGLATLARYGRGHFARITKGHPRRPRHGKEMLAGRSPKVAALSTTTRAKGDRPTNIIHVDFGAGAVIPRPPTKGKVIRFAKR